MKFRGNRSADSKISCLGGGLEDGTLTQQTNQVELTFIVISMDWEKNVAMIFLTVDRFML